MVSAWCSSGLGLLSWVMVRRDLRPLVEITETAGAIAQGDLTQRVPLWPRGPRSANSGKAFNTMIDEIEVAFAERAASEDRLRRFLADASHELRTPLTSILGYAELFDLGLRDRPEELARSLHHIKDEASRMGTLVEDLFLLAQLDRERPLRIEPVDLAELVRRSVAGIGVSAPTARWPSMSPTGWWSTATRHRIRQVVDNLLVNAVIHTPAGDRRSRIRRGRRGRVGRAHRPRRRAGYRSGRPPADLRAVLPGRPVAVPVVGGCRPGAGHRGGHRRRPTGARSGGRPVGGPPSRCGSRSTAGPGQRPPAGVDARCPRGEALSRAVGSSSPGGLRRGLGPGCSGRDVPDRPLDDLARADARGAGVDPLGRSVHQGPNLLDVRVPTPLGPAVGVADVHAERRLFPTDLTHRCHDVPTSFSILRVSRKG